MNTDWTFSRKIIEPSEPLTHAEDTYFKQVQESAKNMFASSYLELGCVRNMPFTIRTTDEIPIYVRPYRKAETERQIINNEIKLMLEAKIIRPSSSPWSSPVVLLKKQDGSLRMCVDYRPLNKKTINEPWPLPRIDDIFDRMYGSYYFTSLDLKSGYWQVPMAEDSIEKTAFSTSDGHYEFLRLPFGLRCAPLHFSKMMHILLRHLTFVEVYLDDITVHSKDVKEHYEHIEAVLTILRKVNVKLNFTKCKWFAKKIKLLGHIITGTKISVDPKRTESIKDRLPPKNIKQLQQFLGLCNYYKKFIQGLAEIAVPLYNLLKKDQKWQWAEDCQNAFDTLKTKLISPPCLRLPDPNKQYYLYCDASGYAIGGILSQKDEVGYYVVSFNGRILKGAELNYTITEKECLAVVYNIIFYQVYIGYSEFVCITDHSAILWLLNKAIVSGRLARWIYALQDKNFTIVHRAGTVHTNVDALSRPVLSMAIQTEIMDTLNNTHDDKIESKSRIIDPYEDDVLLHYLQYKKFKPGCTKNQVNRIKKVCDHYSLINDRIMYRADKMDGVFNIAIPPIIEREDLIAKAHLLGHFGVISTYNTLKQHYYWHNMMNTIKSQIKKCEICNRHQKAPIIHHPAQVLPVTGLFDRIGIDLIGGLSETREGLKYIMVITEYLSKYPYACAIRSKQASEIAEHLTVYITLFGPPKVILSDQGTEFNNSIVKQICDTVGMEHRVTSAYNPRTNGHTERFNGTLINSLKKHTETNPLDWPKWIPFVLMAYRSRIHSNTNFSPYELVFGRRMNYFENWEPQIPNDFNDAILERTKEIKKMVEQDQPKAVETISKNQEKQKVIQDSAVNVEQMPLAEKSTVYVKVEGLKGKLEASFRGPYTVSRHTSNGNYVLINRNNMPLKTTYPRHKLKLVSTDIPINETVYDVEKIMKHKKQANGQFVYLVKWEGYDESHNSWEPEENFVDLKMIQDYWKQIHTVNSLQINLHDSVIFYIVMILLISSLPLAFSMKLKEKLKYCDGHGNSFFVDINGSCDQNKDDHYKHDTIETTYLLLNKMTNAVSGTGWQCKMEEIKFSFSETYFKEEVTTISAAMTKDITAEDCRYMVATKKCIQETMSCENGGCYYEDTPKPEFSYFKTIEKIQTKCIFFPRIITAANVDDLLFSNYHHPCKADSEFCKLHDSVVIWNKDIIHECPFEQIGDPLVMQTVGSRKNLVTSMLEDKTDMYNGTRKTKRKIRRTGHDTVPPLLFKITGSLQACGIDMLTTSEGMFLTTNINQDKFKISKQKIADIKTHFDLTLAESDSRFEEMHRYNEKMINIMCYTTMSLLRVFAHIHDKYVAITDSRKNDLILYSSHGSIYQPVCIDIDEIEIIEKTVYCYKDTPIQFIYNNVTVNAFLNSQGIIKPTSQLQSCNVTFQRILLPSKRVIIRNNTRITLQNKLTISSIFLDVLNIDNAEPNFNHHQNIIQDVNIVQQLEQALKIQEVSGTFLVLPDREDSTDPFKKILGVASSSITKYAKTAWSYLIYVIIGLCVIGILIIIIVMIRCLVNLITCCHKFCCCFLPRRSNSTNTTAVTYIPTDEDIQFLHNYRTQREILALEN